MGKVHEKSIFLSILNHIEYTTYAGNCNHAAHLVNLLLSGERTFFSSPKVVYYYSLFPLRYTAEANSPNCLQNGVIKLYYIHISRPWHLLRHYYKVIFKWLYKNIILFILKITSFYYYVLLFKSVPLFSNGNIRIIQTDIKLDIK